MTEELADFRQQAIEMRCALAQTLQQLEQFITQIDAQIRLTAATGATLEPPDELLPKQATNEPGLQDCHKIATFLIQKNGLAKVSRFMASAGIEMPTTNAARLTAVGRWAVKQYGWDRLKEEVGL